MSNFYALGAIRRPIIIDVQTLKDSPISLEALGLLIRLQVDHNIKHFSAEQISLHYELSINKSKKLMKEILNSKMIEVDEGGQE